MALAKETIGNYEGTGSAVDLPGRVEVLGAPVDPWTMGQTVEATDALIKEGRFAHLIGVNADKLLQMRDDPEMDACVRRCEIVNADGASMVMAAKKLGVDLPERVAGIDLMWELCGLAEREGHSVYLLGAKAEVVAKTAEVLSERYPNMVLAGYRDGYFGEDEFDAVVAEVEQAEPDIVFVGITSPKKERLIERFRELGAKGAFVGVGGFVRRGLRQHPARPDVDAASEPGVALPHDAGAQASGEALRGRQHPFLHASPQGVIEEQGQ